MALKDNELGTNELDNLIEAVNYLGKSLLPRIERYGFLSGIVDIFEE